ncbi:MAG: HEPN domain-containing protein [Bacteroidota bacterium]
MSREEYHSYIETRIHRAEEALAFAKTCFELGNYNMTINRLYYSLFYATQALLAKHESYPKTHSGAKSELGLFYVKTGLLTSEEGKLYSQLLDMRQVSDYGDLTAFEKDDTDTLIPKVSELLEKMKGLI